MTKNRKIWLVCVIALMGPIFLLINRELQQTLSFAGWTIVLLCVIGEAYCLYAGYKNKPV